MKTLRPGIGMLDTRAAPLPPKEADAELLTPEHRAFRKAVCERAKWRCEWIDAGKRCTKRGFIADHIKERADGGALYDPRNGMCLCASHHTLKTNAVRAARQAAPLPAPAKAGG